MASATRKSASQKGIVIVGAIIGGLAAVMVGLLVCVVLGFAMCEKYKR